MADLKVTFGDFDSTTFEVEAISEKGKSFLGKHLGAGAVSAILPKSSAPNFERSVYEDEMNLQVAHKSDITLF